MTDQSQMNQFPAVGASVVGSKGLETGGNKPLMQNRRAPLFERRRERVTAGNILKCGIDFGEVKGLIRLFSAPQLRVPLPVL